jgi:hypothetical protein
MTYLILADFFRENMVHGIGGAEYACDALIELLRPHGKVIAKPCAETTPEFLKEFRGRIIVSNRQTLSEAAKQTLYGHPDGYILWEHDFHYLKSRDAGLYTDFKAPEDEIINREIYEKAHKVVCQSGAQLFALTQNLGIPQGVSSSGNPWAQKHLDFLKTLQDVPKIEEYAVLLHPYPSKNTEGAVSLCKQNGWNYKIVPPMAPQLFLQELAKFQFLVFLPKIFETYSRIAFEARALNLTIAVNAKVGFKYEDHSKLQGLDLIQYAEENNQRILELFK